MRHLLLTAILSLACLCCQSVKAAEASPALAATVEKLSLQIGIPLSRRPYAYLDKDKQAAGILVDIIQRTCQHLQANCTFVGGSTEHLLTDLQTLKLNAVLITDDFLTPEVDKLKLTRSLCKPAPVFVQKADAPARSKPEDFRGSSLAVQEGSIFHIYLLDEYSSQARLMLYPFMSSAIFDLVAGRVDALFTEEAMVQSQIMDTTLNGYVKLTTTVIKMTDMPATVMTLALREQDKDLFSTLDTALSTVVTDQTCSQLLPKPQKNRPRNNP